MYQNSFNVQESSTNYVQPISAHAAHAYGYSHVTFNSETSTISQSNATTFSLASHVPTQAFQPVDELRLFYQAPNDNNIYHVTCKMVLYDYPENSAPLDDDNYDYEFFFQSSNDVANYHVTCKLLSYSSIVNILNREIYGMDFDVNDSRRLFITSIQKLNLELNLKQVLPWYLPQYPVPDGATSLDSNENIMESIFQDEQL